MSEPEDPRRSLRAAWHQMETHLRTLEDVETPEAVILRAVDLLTRALMETDGLLAELERNSWPEPITEEPDLATLEEWLWEDGGCEATDSCWVEVDGVCPHGHPAWLLKLGLV